MKRILLTIGLIVSLLSSFACMRKGAGNVNDDSGPIRVGVYMDLTGQTAGFGKSTTNGIELAADEINAAGGVNGRQVKLLIEDDQGRPEQAKTVVSKLISQDKVHAVLGEVASSNSLAAAPFHHQSPRTKSMGRLPARPRLRRKIGCSVWARPCAAPMTCSHPVATHCPRHPARM